MLLDLPRNTCSWGIRLTDTFRNRSRALLGKWGTNLQNPSDHICRLYIPDSGMIFIQADQAGAEALIVAYLCPPGPFRNLFINGIKSHVYVAMHIFKPLWIKEGFPEVEDWIKLDIAELKQQPRWKPFLKYIKDTDAHNHRYFIGKKSCHSFNYGKQPATFIFDVLRESEGDVVLSAAEGKRIHATYHSLFPELEGIWHREVHRCVSVSRCLRNLFGHPREYYGPITPKLLREAIAFVPQSTVGTITNIAFAFIQSCIDGNSLQGHLLNNKHDSILIEVPDNPDDIKQGCEVLKSSLEQDLVSPRGEPFKMKAEVSVGYNWAKWHPTENPRGMKEV